MENSVKIKARESREATLKTLKQIDDNLWMMEYKSNYGLDALLEKGVGSIMDAVKFLQKQVRTPEKCLNTFLILFLKGLNFLKKKGNMC